MDVVARARRDRVAGDAIARRPIGRSPSRYVVVAPQGLGDCLEATPMLAALRAAFPVARIDVVVLRPAARDLFAGLPQLVDRVIYLPFWERGLAAFLMTAARLPLQSRAEAVFLTFPSARLVYACLAALMPARARYAHSYARNGLRAALGPLIRFVAIAPHHNVLRNMDLLRAADIVTPDPERYIVPAAWARANDRPERLVVMHVGSIAHHGLEAKRWPTERFAELGRRLRSRGYDVTLLAGPSEIEETSRVAAAIGDAAVVRGTLEHATGTIARACLVIANDNGIAHVAAGIGTPVLALFGPTPVEFGPFSPEAVAFRPTACPPCFDMLHTDASCKLNIDFACLKVDLSVDAVEARFVELEVARSRQSTRTEIEM